METKTKNTIMGEEIGRFRKQVFWPMMMVFYGLFVVRNVLAIEFPISLYLIWVAVMAFAFNDTEIKALIISFIPLAPGFQSKYAALVCMIFLLIKYRKRLRVPMFLFILPILMFWELLHMGDGFSTIPEFLAGFAPLLCLAVVVSLPKKREDMSLFSRVLAITLTVSGLILIVSTVVGSHESLVSLIRDGFRLGKIQEAENYQISYNANELGFMCNIAIAGLLTNIYFENARKIDYIITLFLILIGCLTVSRAFLLCLAGTIVLYVILQNTTFSHKVKVFASVSLILIASLLILKISAPNIIDNYITRFSVDDITSGRTYLLEFYNDFITSSFERLFYGIGIQNMGEKVWYLEGVKVNVPHNGYQQLIVAWGLVGLILMILFILYLVLHARKQNQRVQLMCYLPLFILLVNILAGQFVTSGTKLFSLIFIYLMIYNGGAETEKIHKQPLECTRYGEEEKDK